MTESITTTPTIRTGTFTGSGPVTGTVVAVPSVGRFNGVVTLQISFSADPGFYTFSLYGSLDGTNFSIIDNPEGYSETFLNTYTGLNVRFLRVDQLSKQNSVTATVQLNHG